MKIKLGLCSLILLTGCNNSKMQSSWLEAHEGNEFRIYSGTVGDDKDNIKYVNVYNTMRTWNGNYQGGEEKIADRKNLLFKIADKEAARICIKGYKRSDEPYFQMTDKHENTFGGGLLGLAIAHMAASDQNIPIGLSCQYTCITDKLSVKK